MRLRIPYIRRLLDVGIPERNLVFDIEPRAVPATADMANVIRQALAHPIGTPPLHELVQAGQKVIIIADDNTRPTPTKQIIPILLDSLNSAGVPDRDIRVIVAQGTHRAMTPEEIDEKYGQPVLSRVELLPHKYKDPTSLVAYGTTRRGTRIWVNRHVVEADVRIAVGNVIPHHPTGWSGGAKAVLPGVAGEETVAQMHLLGSRDPALGRLDTEMRQEMEDFAQRIGLSFVVQLTMNRQGELVAATAGHFIQAHRAAVQNSTRVYGLPIPEQADLTISSTSPVDFDFYQGDKGITSAEPATRPGGEIVLVSGCLEGVSPAHPELGEYVGRMSNEQVWQLVQAGQTPDPLTAAEAIVINDIRARMRITTASEGLSPVLCAQLGFGHIPPDELGDYVARRLADSPALKIGVLRQSAEVWPYVAGPGQDS